jgi:5-hydroxyisourate hydrolase
MISTHILDTSMGKPAESVAVVLQIKDGNTWKDLSHGSTNADGRFVFDCKNVPGIYQITFAIEDYFKKSGRESFFMNTPVIFNVVDTNRKYHVPLLLNPFGYSTYRGS